MKIKLAMGLALALGLTAAGQDAGNSPVGQTQQSPDPGSGPGQRGGPGGGRGWGGMIGRGMMGTVSEIAADHFTIKTDSGETRTVNFSVNTRMIKQPPPRRGNDGERTPPQPIKASDIKVGDDIGASGEMDATGKSLGAVLVVLLDPERAKQMREMQANFGKTWVMGRVTAMQDTKITLQSPVDNASHTVEADENTTFRKRRDLVTMADVQVGDNVRVDGAIKGGVFMASTINVMGAPRNGAPRADQDQPPQ